MAAPSCAYAVCGVGVQLCLHQKKVQRDYASDTLYRGTAKFSAPRLRVPGFLYQPTGRRVPTLRPGIHSKHCLKGRVKGMLDPIRCADLLTRAPLSFLEQKIAFFRAPPRMRSSSTVECSVAPLVARADSLMHLPPGCKPRKASLLRVPLRGFHYHLHPAARLVSAGAVRLLLGASSALVAPCLWRGAGECVARHRPPVTPCRTSSAGCHQQGFLERLCLAKLRIPRCRDGPSLRQAAWGFGESQRAKGNWTEGRTNFSLPEKVTREPCGHRWAAQEERRGCLALNC